MSSHALVTALLGVLIIVIAGLNLAFPPGPARPDDDEFTPEDRYI
jgi:hypothetical protein